MLYTRRLKIILQSRYIFKILAIICISYSIIIDVIYPFKSKYKITSQELEGIITKYEIDGDKLTLNINAKEKIIINYYFKTKEELNTLKKEIKLGDTYYVKGIFNKPVNNTIPNLFNYKKYLKRKRIYYIVIANSTKKTKNNTSIFYFLKNKIKSRIENIDKLGYLETFILGENDNVTTKSLENFRLNGISHLFSISGMHVSLLVGIIMFFLNKVSYNNFYKYSIVIIILIFYLFLTGISSSILRTTIMTITVIINKLFNLKIKKIDIMLIVLIIAITINPFIIFEIGFQFSYVISLSLNIISQKINKTKNGLSKNLITSLICFIVSFPICIYHFQQVNFLSIILNLIMIPLVSVVIFPLSIITFIVPSFYNLYTITINILESINNFASNINIFTITFTKPSLIIVMLYYILIILIILNKKTILFFIIAIIIHKYYPYLDNKITSTIIDVGQGDSILIKYPYNKSNILIDTGGITTYNNKEEWMIRENNYSISNDKIIPYLKSIGINKLDYLIISHGDYDHMGEAINLVENFKVEKVIFNCGEFNELEKDLIEVLDKKKIPYYSCIKELNIDKNKLYFLNNKDYGNENDNSSVIYTELNNYKFLFMGDAGVEVEEDLIEKYNLKDIDVLKVGHHGSKTSSGKKFINEINPKYSIISVGKNNRYGHPNKEVLFNLENSKIYRTDQDGSIMFKIKNNKLKIETCTP